jgi:small subunit ribosomal protein S20
MPYHKSAKKRILTSKNAASRNRQVKSKINTATKKFLNTKSKEEMQEELKNTYSIIDKAVKKRVINKNKAANLKSKLSKKIQSVSK